MNSSTRCCTKCHNSFPATADHFRSNKIGSLGLSSWCKTCASQYDKDHYRKHSTQKRAYVASKSDKKREYDLQYRIDHAEKRSEYNREYHANNPKIEASKRNRRRARVKELPYKWTAEEWDRCLSCWLNRCAICGKTSGNGFIIVQDHWIAITDKRIDNPGTVAENIIPVCHAKCGAKGGCNNSKWALDPQNWLYGKYPKEQADEILARIQDYFEWVTH